MKKFLGKLFLFLLFGIVIKKSVDFIDTLTLNELTKKILTVGLKKSTIVFFIWILKEPFLLVKNWTNKFSDDDEKMEVL